MNSTAATAAPEQPRSHRRRILRAIAARNRLTEANPSPLPAAADRDSPHRDDFLWSQVCERAAVEQVTVSELVRHAVAYYLADLDEGRVSARCDLVGWTDRTGPGRPRPQEGEERCREGASDGLVSSAPAVAVEVGRTGSGEVKRSVDPSDDFDPLAQIPPPAVLEARARRNRRALSAEIRAAYAVVSAPFPET